jgi:hypothetical protein
MRPHFTSLFFFVAPVAACASTPQHEDAATPLVVPPLGPDAGAPDTTAERRMVVQSPFAVPARAPSSRGRVLRARTRQRRPVRAREGRRDVPVARRQALAHQEETQLHARAVWLLRVVSAYGEVLRYPSSPIADEATKRLEELKN